MGFNVPGGLGWVGWLSCTEAQPAYVKWSVKLEIIRFFLQIHQHAWEFGED